MVFTTIQPDSTNFEALPPGINSARMCVGAGSGPMPAATAAPYVGWLTTIAEQAKQEAAHPKSAASAFETAFAVTMPPTVVAANRTQLAPPVATNMLGRAIPAVAATEAQHAEMWAQHAAPMYGYAGSSAGRVRCAVDCEVCREALSARLDGEAEPASPAEVDEHLSKCPACRRWQAEAATLTRALRCAPWSIPPIWWLPCLMPMPTGGSGDEERSRRSGSA